MKIQGDVKIAIFDILSSSPGVLILRFLNLLNKSQKFFSRKYVMMGIKTGANFMPTPNFKSRVVKIYLGKELYPKNDF